MGSTLAARCPDGSTCSNGVPLDAAWVTGLRLLPTAHRAVVVPRRKPHQAGWRIGEPHRDEGAVGRERQGLQPIAGGECRRPPSSGNWSSVQSFTPRGGRLVKKVHNARRSVSVIALAAGTMSVIGSRSGWPLRETPVVRVFSNSS